MHGNVNNNKWGNLSIYFSPLHWRCQYQIGAANLWCDFQLGEMKLCLFQVTELEVLLYRVSTGLNLEDGGHEALDANYLLMFWVIHYICFLNFHLTLEAGRHICVSWCSVIISLKELQTFWWVNNHKLKFLYLSIYLRHILYIVIVATPFQKMCYYFYSYSSQKSLVDQPCGCFCLPKGWYISPSVELSSKLIDSLLKSRTKKREKKNLKRTGY